MEKRKDVKKEVRQFYDQIGWQQVDEGLYQNVRYEDLRPISREYIHRCHLRVLRHLKPHGRYLLDEGSGPIQYPEYLEYSEYFRYRVCVDLSIVALQEARKRIGSHGLFVVADVAHLPFKKDVFDGAVSLHTFHHLPSDEHRRAYDELYRVLAPERSAVVVNGWSNPPLTMILESPLYLRRLWRKLRRSLRGKDSRTKEAIGEPFPKATYVEKNTYAQLKRNLNNIPIEVWTWRSVSVRFLRAYIHPQLSGDKWLDLLYRLEERFPRFFGKYGQYPLIVVRKP